MVHKRISGSFLGVSGPQTTFVGHMPDTLKIKMIDIIVWGTLMVLWSAGFFAIVVMGIKKDCN